MNLRKKAELLDKEDPLKKYRSAFSLPSKKTYFCTHSLGLPAENAFCSMQKQMQKWKEFGAHAWFHGEDNWYSSLDQSLKEYLAKLLGAKNEEVAVMNSLTVNLHLLMVSFYQPSKERYKILIDAPTFPSDLYAIKSHLINHGLDPQDALIIVEPRENEHLIRQEDIEKAITDKGNTIALVYLNPVNFLTGQALDITSIAKLAKSQGCLIGLDIAHAAGNIPLDLHASNVDFAVGCSYKYLSSGPGGPGIAFVHSSHHDKDLPRLSGWWGNDPSTRFKMHLEKEFIPFGGADSWKVSTPSILALAPLLASLEIFQEAGIENIRKKSELQTAFLLELLEELPKKFSIVTPNDPKDRGSMVSLLLHGDGEKIVQKLEQKGIICDFRQPNMIRISPSPLYSSFEEIYKFVCQFAEILGGANDNPQHDLTIVKREECSLSTYCS